jgi:hypothetical protein
MFGDVERVLQIERERAPDRSSDEARQFPLKPV